MITFSFIGFDYLAYMLKYISEIISYINLFSIKPMMLGQERAYPLLTPRGRLSVFSSRHGFVNTQSKAEVAAAIARQNTPNFLQNAFFGKETQILQLNPKDKEGDVCIMVPTSPYTEGTTMVVASDHSVPTGAEQNGIVPTRKIYDYSDRIQEGYWTSILDSLRYYQDHIGSLFPSGDRQPSGNIIAIENSMSAISDQRFRTPRSIALPHTHIVPINYAQIEPSTKQIWHLQLEQRIIASLAKSDYPPHEQIWDRLPPEIQKLFSEKIIAHLVPPYGYVFSVPKDISAAQFSRLMFAHDQAFCAVNTELIEHYASYKKRDVEGGLYRSNRDQERQAGFIPPGSYRVYIERVEDSFVIRISPAFVSHAGAMESMGIVLHRSPDNPRYLSEEQVNTFLNDFRVFLNGKFMRD